MQIGFIGLGIMGKPMAAHLVRGGHRLFLHSRSGVPQDLRDMGGQVCASPREVAQCASMIITMLPRTADVEQVLFGQEGVVQGIEDKEVSERQMVVDMSTVSPSETRKFAARINQLDCDYVDAPVSGGEVGAREATLTIMVGAEENVFRKVSPVLALMGKTITRIGGAGTGQICKAANQIVAALTIEGVAEALLFASKAGADPARVRDALMGGFAGSRILEVHGERMIRHAFSPGFRMELHQKDLDIVLAEAQTLGMSLPNTVATRGLFATGIADGSAMQDSSAIVQVLERMAGHTI